MSVSPPQSGHFEIKNKTNMVCCVKLISGRMDKNWSLLEMVRPSFIAIEPGLSVYCSFDASENKDGKLDLIVLYDNSNMMISSGRIVSDTRAPGVKADNISPCAQIPKFQSASAFKLFATDQNAIVKIIDKNGKIIVSPREGNSLERVGFMNKINGHRFIGNKVDFSTNTTLVKCIQNVE
jgi:hypothetical protein